MFKKLLFIAWVGLIAFSVGCKGTDGDVGPKGDTGATGPAGPAGPAGKDGEGGSGGGAFVFTNGADTTDAEGAYYSGFSGLTADNEAVLKNAAVLVYIKSQGVFWPVPGLVSFDDNKVSHFTFVHYIDKGNFLVDIFQTDWSEQQEKAPTRIAQDIKVIVVPAQQLARRSKEINYKSYEETMAALGLTDKDVRQFKKTR